MTTQTQTVPDQHSSLVGGSTAARRLACPASVAYEKMVPDTDTSSPAAREGTTLHEMMTILLNDPDKQPSDLVPFTFTHKEGWEHTVGADTWEKLGQPALDAFLDYMEEIEADVKRLTERDEEFRYLIEKQVEFPGIVGAFGTADVIWRCGPLAGVWDWKFGYGEVVAEENAQLLFYATAARATHPEWFEGVAELDLAIMQPARDEKPSVWTIQPDQLDTFADDLRQAVLEAKTLGKDARLEKGGHCKYARCKNVCPLYRGAAMELGRRLSEIKERQEPKVSMTETIRNEPDFMEQLPDLLELAEMTEAFVSSIFATAQDLAESDDEARDQLREAGWVLKDKKPGARKWVVDEKKVMNGARYRGLKIDDFAPRQLLSPAQLEKALKAVGNEMPEGWAKSPPSSGTTLVRQTGAVKEHASPVDRYKALAEKLAHL